MRIPAHLEHKPLFVAEGYEAVDGPYAGRTDAKALSVGLATWDNFQVGVKVWRYSEKGRRWSRLSEDLPPHRAIDLTLLYLLTRLARASGRATEVAQHGSFELVATLYNHDRPPSPGMLHVLDTHFEAVGSIIRERLLALAKVLDEMRQRGLL